MELTQQEVMAIIGEQALQIAAQRKHIAALEARLKALTDGNVKPIREAADGAS